jgi:hypothetical protein
MDKETIQQIATEVVAQLPFGARYSVVYGVVTVLIAGLSIWFGSFLKTKGQNFATKQDFDELQKQLKANTELVETIKSEVGQKDWASREWTNLRRTKLEALLTAVRDCEAYIDRLRSGATKGKFEAGERDPVSELVAIGDLFPELVNEVARFSHKCREQAITGMNHAITVSRVGDDRDAYQTAHDSFREHWGSGYKELLVARDELTGAAHRLLVSIMGVEEGSRDNRSEAPTETH